LKKDGKKGPVKAGQQGGQTALMEFVKKKVCVRRKQDNAGSKWDSRQIINARAEIASKGHARWGEWAWTEKERKRVRKSES